MARRGLNCTLSYSRNGESRAYRVRVSRLTSGYEMLGAESQARDSRAFYPYQTVPSQFAITLLLIGGGEKRSFNTFMMRYAEYILDPSIKGEITPQMRVSLPSRNYVREGVPVSGTEFGDKLGAIVWQPNVVFEVSREPSDWQDNVPHSLVSSRMARLREPETEFFYPTGTQLHGDKGAAVQSAVLGLGVSGGSGVTLTDDEGDTDEALDFILGGGGG